MSCKQHCYSIEKLIVTKNLNINNCIAIGSDNACIMVGINNGVYSKLKQENPSLILMRCVCHSMQRAMSYASAECLPRNLEYLISETPNWFGKSSVRQCQYSELYNAINDGSQSMKIPSDCQTRRLFIQTDIENIIAQWSELRAHFKIARLSEKCLTFKLLFQMYSDEKNLAVFLFCNQS